MKTGTKAILIFALIALTSVIITGLTVNSFAIRPSEAALPAAGIGRIAKPPEEAGDTTLTGYGDITATENELEECAKLVWLEARGESEQCQRAIAETIFNRLRSDSFPDTLHEVIFQEGQFSPAANIPNSETTDRIREIVYEVFENGNTIADESTMFFRADFYHKWTGAIALFNIDNTYFSASEWCR